MIRHLWLDFSETIVFLQKENHDRLRYGSYAEVTGRPLTPELSAEYDRLYETHKHSNAAVFRSLGMPPSYWSERVNSMKVGELYKLADPDFPSILQEIRRIVPVSVFSNIDVTNILPTFGIATNVFTHLLNSKVISAPKPALDGFRMMVERSNLPANELLYVGDDIEKDIKPAKQVGMKAGLMWKTSPEANYCFNGFADLLAVIKKQ